MAKHVELKQFKRRAASEEGLLTRATEADQASLAGVDKPARRGRSPKQPTGLTHRGVRLTVTYGLLQDCWRALQAAHDAPESERTTRLIADAAKALMERTGGHIAEGLAPVDGDWGGKRGPSSRTYRITTPTGKVRDYPNAGEAAAALGITPGSLTVAMGRNGGTYRRATKIWDDEANAEVTRHITCETL